MGEHLTIILKEMCSRVGASYDDVDFKDEEWFLDYTWNEEQENEFRDWLADYFYKNVKARRELLNVNYKNKDRCMKAANEFVFQYGWKLDYIDKLANG